MRLPKDIQVFLDGYPHQEDNESLSANLDFYSGKICCKPDDLRVDEIHQRWLGDYQTLECKHGFIQWLFPIREYGINPWSQPLQVHEIRAIKADGHIIANVLASYQLMLDFYGMRLASPDTGLLERSVSPANFAARYRNLVRSHHNYLRITRILKCLSELGLEHLNAGFLLHVLNEQSEFNQLNSSAITRSMDNWWANCIRKEEEREWIRAVIRKVRAGDGYVFTRSEYETAFRKRAATGSLNGESIPPNAV